MLQYDIHGTWFWTKERHIYEWFQLLAVVTCYAFTHYNMQRYCICCNQWLILWWLTCRYSVMVRRTSVADIAMYPLNSRSFFPVLSIIMNCNIKHSFTRQPHEEAITTHWDRRHRRSPLKESISVECKKKAFSHNQSPKLLKVLEKQHLQYVWMCKEYNTKYSMTLKGHI